MSHRFVHTKTSSPFKNIIISLLIFILATGSFWFLVDNLSAKTKEKELETLNTAINHGITQCYAIEGAYPQDLQYLKDNYGITYDQRRFIVHYEVLGQNILPTVTIISKGD